MYYLQKYVELLIRKTIIAVTVMLAVMKIIQKIDNAVPVMPVKCIQPHPNISCFDVIVVFCGRFDILHCFLADVEMASIYPRGEF